MKIPSSQLASLYYSMDYYGVMDRRVGMLFWSEDEHGDDLDEKSNRQALRGSKCCYTEPAFLHVFPVISCDIHYYPLSCRLQPFVSLGTHLDLQDTCQVELTCCHLLAKYGKVKG